MSAMISIIPVLPIDLIQDFIKTTVFFDDNPIGKTRTRSQ